MQSAAKSTRETRPTLSTNAHRNGGDKRENGAHPVLQECKQILSSYTTSAELMIRGEPKLSRHPWDAHRAGQFAMMAAVSHLPTARIDNIGGGVTKSSTRICLKKKTKRAENGLCHYADVEQAMHIFRYAPPMSSAIFCAAAAAAAAQWRLWIGRSFRSCLNAPPP